MTNGRDDWPDPLDGSGPPERLPPSESGRSAFAGDGAGRRHRAFRLIGLAVVVALIVRTVLGVALAANAERVSSVAVSYFVSSSVFFIGVPALLAWLLVRRQPAATAMGRVMAGTTLGLLLTAMVLGEGALCVMFAAPLAYGAAAIVVAVRRHQQAGPASFLLIALLVPGLQLQASDRIQEVTIVREVALSPGQVAARIAAGPDFFDVQRPWPLTLGYPVPSTVQRRTVGADVQWRFPYGRGATTVAMRDRPDGYDFTVLDDTAMPRWFRWERASVTWEPAGDGTRVRMTLAFDPALGPDWYFGTIEGRFMSAVGTHLLDAMDLAP